MICPGAQDAAARLHEVQTNLLLCDLDGADLTVARRLMDHALVSHPAVARVLVGEAGQSEPMAGIARDVAAHLYLMKPAPAELLRLVAKRARELGELSRRHRLLSRELKISMDDDLFGRGPELSVGGHGRRRPGSPRSSAAASPASRSRSCSKTSSTLERMDAGAPAADSAELDRLPHELAALEALAEAWGPTERAAYYPTDRALNMPYAVAVAGGRLAVADTANSRLVGFPAAAEAADRLSGQPDFAAKGDNRWGLPTRDSLSWPYGLSVLCSRMAVADSGNNRVSIWEMAP